jgi:hypothetical protein
VFEAGQPAVGSATLIAPDWVMTAAHVVEGGRGVRFQVGGQSYAATRWIANPRYDGSLINGYDIALVQLAQPVVGVTPAQLYRGKAGVRRGGDVRRVRPDRDRADRRRDRRPREAGRDERDRRPAPPRPPRAAAGRPEAQSNYRTFAVDFDAPDNPSENRIGSPDPTDLEYLISRGDSGGAVFVDDPRDAFGPQVAGVHSFGEIFDERDDSDYGDMTGHTRVRSFAKWIDKVVVSERYRRNLRFISPTQAAQELGFDDLGSDPSARSIGASPGTTGVPEPTSVAIMAAAGVGLLARRRRHRHSARM